MGSVWRRTKLINSLWHGIKMCICHNHTCGMKRWLNKVAVVTGAGGGIGFATCQKLCCEGMRVIAVDLETPQILEKLDKLKELTYGEVFTETCDVTDEQQVVELFKKVETDYCGVDVCICCAGLALPSPIMDGQLSNWRTQMDVNLMGLALCSREALASMKRRNITQGHLLHINSVSGHRVSEKEDLHFYQVTKHALAALGEALRLELSMHRVPVKLTQVSPGYVCTCFWKKMYQGYQDKDRRIQKIKPQTEKLLEAEDIADVILFAVATPPHVVINDIIFRTMGTTL